MTGLYTRRRYEEALDDTINRNTFDGFMMAFALATSLYLSQQHWGTIRYDVALDDTVVVPICETCKTAEPGSWWEWYCKWVLWC